MGFLFILDSGTKKGAKKKGSSFQTVSALFRVKYKFNLKKYIQYLWIIIIIDLDKLGGNGTISNSHSSQDRAKAVPLL